MQQVLLTGPIRTSYHCPVLNQQITREFSQDEWEAGEEIVTHEYGSHAGLNFLCRCGEWHFLKMQY